MSNILFYCERTKNICIYKFEQPYEKQYITMTLVFFLKTGLDHRLSKPYRL